MNPHASVSRLNVVIPVKDPGTAKERLSSVLSPSQREELALLLFERTLTLFKGLSGRCHVLVVTESAAMEQRARMASVNVLRESNAAGETAAVELATAWSIANGFESQLVVPADMADPDPAELATLLARPWPRPSLVLCPATDDDGTNAILTTPADVIPFRFGAASFPEYRRTAAERGVPCEVLRLPSLVLDLDAPADLQALLAREDRHPVADLLRTWKLAAKS